MCLICNANICFLKRWIVWFLYSAEPISSALSRHRAGDDTPDLRRDGLLRYGRLPHYAKFHAVGQKRRNATPNELDAIHTGRRTGKHSQCSKA